MGKGGTLISQHAGIPSSLPRYPSRKGAFAPKTNTFVIFDLVNRELMAKRIYRVIEGIHLVR